MLLRSKDKAALISIFESVKTPFEVWAHGSRVNGHAHEASDLDLVVRGHQLQKLPVEVFSELKGKIRDSNIPIVVELLDWARLPESFHRGIEDCHEVLFSNMHTQLNEPTSKYEKKGDSKG